MHRFHFFVFPCAADTDVASHTVPAEEDIRVSAAIQTYGTDFARHGSLSPAPVLLAWTKFDPDAGDYLRFALGL